MGRRYWVDLTPTSVSAATVDLLCLEPADDKPIRVLSLNLHQTSDFGDAQDEVLSVKWVRGNTTSGSGGNTVTPRPCVPSDAAAGFVAESFNTTAASVGTTVTLSRHGFAVRGGLERPYTPDEVIQTTQAVGFLALRLETAPADPITIGGSVLVEEMG